jgi:hypothetical protein
MNFLKLFALQDSTTLRLVNKHVKLALRENIVVIALFGVEQSLLKTVQVVSIAKLVLNPLINILVLKVHTHYLMIKI